MNGAEVLGPRILHVLTNPLKMVVPDLVGFTDPVACHCVQLLLSVCFTSTHSRLLEERCGKHSVEDTDHSVRGA